MRRFQERAQKSILSPFQSQKWSFLSTVNRYLHEFKTDFSEAKVSKRARHTFRLVSYFLYNMTHTEGGFFFKMYLPAIGFLQRGKILDVIDGCVPKEGKILLFEATLFDFLSQKKESLLFGRRVGKTNGLLGALMRGVRPVLVSHQQSQIRKHSNPLVFAD